MPTTIGPQWENRLLYHLRHSLDLDYITSIQIHNGMYVTPQTELMELEVEKWKSKAEVLAHQVESLKTHVKQVVKCSPEVEELKQSKS